MKKFTLIALLFFTACTSKPSLPKYDIITDDTGVGYTEKDLKIYDKLSNKQLIDIASRIKQNEVPGITVKLLFWLPNQVKGRDMSYRMIFYPSEPSAIKAEKLKDNNGEAFDM